MLSELKYFIDNKLQVKNYFTNILRQLLLIFQIIYKQRGVICLNK